MNEHENRSLPPDTFDQVLQQWSGEYDEDYTDSAYFDEIIQEYVKKTDDVIAQLRELFPQLEYDDDFAAEVFEFVRDAPEAEQDLTDERIAAYKLDKATNVVGQQPAERQEPLLRAIDMVVPGGQQMSLLTPDEIRFMNLAHNGRSPERELYYGAIHLIAARDLTPAMQERLTHLYGAHDDIRSLAHAAVVKGAELATAEWERYRTHDALEEIRDKRYRDKLIKADLLLNYHLTHTSLSFDPADFDNHVEMARKSVFHYLEENDGVHKH